MAPMLLSLVSKENFTSLGPSMLLFHVLKPRKKYQCGNKKH